MTEWEIKGAPLRVELGPRDLAEGQVTLARRDTGEKAATPLAGLAAVVPGLLATVQADLLAAATRRRDDRTHDVATLDEAAEAARAGFARLPWAAVGIEGEARLAQGGVTVRCLQRPRRLPPRRPGRKGPGGGGGAGL